MASFSDLSPYLYCHHARRAGTVNIGWIDRRLDDSEPRSMMFLRQCLQGLPVRFGVAASEPLPAEFIEKLWRFCAYSCVHYRGFHLCNLGECAKKREFVVPQATCNGRTVDVGYSELRVFGKRGIIYAAPTLIFHYITAHGYRPPMAFIDAVLHGPQPGTKGYFLRMKDLGLDYWHTREDGKYETFLFGEPSFWQRCWIRAQDGAIRFFNRSVRECLIITERKESVSVEFKTIPNTYKLQPPHERGSSVRIVCLDGVNGSDLLVY